MPAPLISGVQGTVSGYLHGGYPPCSFISGHLHRTYVRCRSHFCPPAPRISGVQVAIPRISPVLLGIPAPTLWGVQVESMLAALPICGVHMYPADQVGGGNGSEDGLAAASCSRLDVCAFYNRKQLNRGFNKVLCRLAQLRPAPHQSGSALVQLVMLH